MLREEIRLVISQDSNKAPDQAPKLMKSIELNDFMFYVYLLFHCFKKIIFIS